MNTRGNETGWKVFAIVVPIGWAVVLLFHGAVDSEAVYPSLADQAGRWLLVHLLTLLFIGLVALVLYRLVRDLSGAAAQLAKVSAGLFALFYGAGEALLGVGTGVLVREGAAEGAQILWDNFITADLFLGVGTAAWFAGTISAAVAHARSGASKAVVALLSLSAIAGVHTPPFSTIGLLSFATAAFLLLRNPTTNPQPGLGTH